MLNAYVILGLTPLAACALLLVASLLVTADWYRPVRRALAPLFVAACLSLLTGIGALLAMALA